MFTKKLLVSALMAAGLLGGAALPLPSIAAVDIYVNTAPPPPRHERVPDHRSGYVWAPGYWNWQGNRHVWVKGHWVKERHGYSYRANDGSSTTGAGSCAAAAGTVTTTAFRTAAIGILIIRTGRNLMRAVRRTAADLSATKRGDPASGPRIHFACRPYRAEPYCRPRSRRRVAPTSRP